MTIMSDKPKPRDEPLSSESGRLASDHGGADADAQSSRGNGAVVPDLISMIDEDIQKHLGRNLKASYDELVRQPIPDTFRHLLEQLERRVKQQ